MKQFHIHLYAVVGKAEVDLEAMDEKEAKEKALKMAAEDSLPLKTSDCKMIALASEK